MDGGRTDRRGSRNSYLDDQESERIQIFDAQFVMKIQRCLSMQVYHRKMNYSRAMIDTHIYCFIESNYPYFHKACVLVHKPYESMDNLTQQNSFDFKLHIYQVHYLDIHNMIFSQRLGSNKYY